MKKQENKNLTSFADHLDLQYKKRGTKEREEFEEGFEAFKIGAMLQGLRNQERARNDTRAVGAKMRDDQDIHFPD